MRINLNGLNIDISSTSNICIKNNNVYVNGEKLEDLSKYEDKEITLEINGDVHNIDCSGNVKCNNVYGDIDCSGSITCEKIEGDIDCSGNISCGDVAGDIDCSGNVVIRRN